MSEGVTVLKISGRRESKGKLALNETGAGHNLRFLLRDNQQITEEK